MLPQLGGVSFAITLKKRYCWLSMELTFVGCTSQQNFHKSPNYIWIRDESSSVHQSLRVSPNKRCCVHLKDWLQMKLEPRQVGLLQGFNSNVPASIKNLFISLRAHPTPGSFYQLYIKSVSVYLENGTEPKCFLLLDSCVNKRQAKLDQQFKGGKFLKKLWCCVGGEYCKMIWFYQLG